MTRKKNAKAQDDEKDVYLKVKLTPNERKMIKMAAAECEKSISDFMHDAIMERAEQETMKYYQRELAPRKSRR